MTLLERIDGPEELRAVPVDQLPALAEEIRGFLVEQVSRTGGHLGPNLGVVELTMAIHRVFRTPQDTVVFDTGHQSYVHKLLTGRRDFSGLRRQGGLSGYPSRAESEHDVVENSHASTSLSWAHGIAAGRVVRGVGALVVVDDDDERQVGLGRDVVEGLPRHATGEGAVADDGDGVPVALAPHDPAGGDAVRPGQRRRRVGVLDDVVL